MGNKLFFVRPGLWKRIRKEIYEREEGICQKCGNPVKDASTDPDFYPSTDRPTWTIHHVISLKSIQIRSRSLCENLSGQEYIMEIRNVFTRLATEKKNLELRCMRPTCKQH